MGLEPQWTISVVLPTKQERDKRIEATTSWIPHYRDATIIIKPSLVTDRERYTRTIIHELFHVRMADIHDWIIEQTPSSRRNEAINVIERCVSEVTNLYLDSFISVHEKELRKFY